MGYAARASTALSRGHKVSRCSPGSGQVEFNVEPDGFVLNSSLPTPGPVISHPYFFV